MIRDEFFKDENGYLALAESTRKDFDAMWAAVLLFEKNTGLSVDQWLGRDGYRNLFSYFTPGVQNLFVKRVRMFRYYLKYLENRCLLQEGSEYLVYKYSVEDPNGLSSISVVYHPTIKELYEDVEASILLCSDYDGSARERESVFLYLAWFGLTKEEILEFKKTDVLDTKLVIRGNAVDVPAYVMNVFRSLKYSLGFSVLRRHEVFNAYADSPYLIRPTNSGEKIGLSRMQHLVAQLNNAGDGRYGLTYSKVHQSGIFYRVYLAEAESNWSIDLNDSSVASKLFETDLTDPRALSTKLKDYANFKSIFLAYLN